VPAGVATWATSRIRVRRAPVTGDRRSRRDAR
jgi:hypothetical protein